MGKPATGRKTLYTSIDGALYRRVRQAAAERDESTSAFVAEALRTAIEGRPSAAEEKARLAEVEKFLRRNKRAVRGVRGPAPREDVHE